jgi:hypothetical protein
MCPMACCGSSSDHASVSQSIRQSNMSLEFHRAHSFIRWGWYAFPILNHRERGENPRGNPRRKTFPAVALSALGPTPTQPDQTDATCRCCRYCGNMRRDSRWPNRIAHGIMCHNVMKAPDYGKTPSDRVPGPYRDSAAMLRWNDGRKVSIRNCRSPEGTSVFLLLTGKRTHAVSAYDNSFEGVSTIWGQGPEVAGSALTLWSNHTAL